MRLLLDRRHAGAPAHAPVSAAAAARGIGSVTLLATDGAARFARVGSRFLGESLAADAVQIVDL
jgi:hypothetical protein